MVALETSGIAAGEVIGAQILVRDVPSEHVPNGSQEGVLDSPDGFFGPWRGFHAVIQGVVVAALGAAGRPCGFVERGADQLFALPVVAAWRFPALSCVPGQTRAHEAK